MPANLTPNYLEAEKRFKEATNVDEKISILEEMIALLPKHKGTDKIFGDLKHRLSKLKEAKETQKKVGHRELWLVKKEGAGQVAIVGPPNSGKSLLLSKLTNARPQVADYPFTTTHAVPGMMRFEDIQIQLVELPAVTADVMATWVPNAVTMADALIIMVDLAADSMLEDVEAIFKSLMARRIEIVSRIPEDPKPGHHYISTIIVGNKIDMSAAADAVSFLKEWLESSFPDTRFDVIEVSAMGDTSIDILPRRIFDLMRIIRVYPKRPGKKIVKEDPLILPVGATVLNAATKLHKDIAATLKSAKGWGPGIYDGQNLARDFVLKDGYVLEFH